MNQKYQLLFNLRQTQSVLCRHVHTQLHVVQYCPCRLVSQHQVRSNLCNRKCAAGIFWAHQHKICINIQIGNDF